MSVIARVAAVSAAKKVMRHQSIPRQYHFNVQHDAFRVLTYTVDSSGASVTLGMTRRGEPIGMLGLAIQLTRRHGNWTNGSCAVTLPDKQQHFFTLQLGATGGFEVTPVQPRK